MEELSGGDWPGPDPETTERETGVGRVPRGAPRPARASRHTRSFPRSTRPRGYFLFQKKQRRRGRPGNGTRDVAQRRRRRRRATATRLLRTCFQAGCRTGSRRSSARGSRRARLPRRPSHRRRRGRRRRGGLRRGHRRLRGAEERDGGDRQGARGGDAGVGRVRGVRGLRGRDERVGGARAGSGSVDRRGRRQVEDGVFLRGLAGCGGTGSRGRVGPGRGAGSPDFCGALVPADADRVLSRGYSAGGGAGYLSGRTGRRTGSTGTTTTTTRLRRLTKIGAQRGGEGQVRGDAERVPIEETRTNNRNKGEQVAYIRLRVDAPVVSVPHHRVEGIGARPLHEPLELAEDGVVGLHANLRDDLPALVNPLTH